MSENLFRLGHYRLTTKPKAWETIGTITVSNTTLAVGGRDWDTVDAIATANKAAWSIPKDINAGEFRFQTTADADAQVVEVWATAERKDHYTLMATLTLTGGTQEGDSSQYFVDTIVASTEHWPQVGTVCDSASNRICRYVIDMAGYTNLVFIATTLAASTTLTCQGRGY